MKKNKIDKNDIAMFQEFMKFMELKGTDELVEEVVKQDLIVKDIDEKKEPVVEPKIEVKEPEVKIIKESTDNTKLLEEIALLKQENLKFKELVNRKVETPVDINLDLIEGFGKPKEEKKND